MITMPIMPKYKMLRGVAHNLGHSFLSLMNYLKYDYCLDYLYAISRIKNINSVEIDFLDCRLHPKYFDLRELICSVHDYRGRFYMGLANMKISPAEIKSVKMRIKFDNKIKKTTKSHKFRDKAHAEVLIKLKNGKEYSNKFEEYWLLDNDKNYKKLYQKIIT